MAKNLENAIGNSLVKDPKSMKSGASLLLDVLLSEGVEYIFGNPGTTELPLLDAMIDVPEIHYVLALQEASAVAMADGYAQAARKPAFLNLHTAGGMGHGMGNLLNASVSHTPLVVTAGQQDTRHIINDPLLFADLIRLAGPAVKWAQEVLSADQLPVLLHRAFNDCVAAPAGPVFLSLPMDVMEEMTAKETGRPSIIDRRATAGSLDVLARILADVVPGKLAIIAGDEIYWSDAAEEVVSIAEILGAKVFGSSWPSRGSYPTSHPLWSGHLPTRAVEIADCLHDYSAVFAIGGKSLITILYSEGSAVPPGCELYQLSEEVRDLGRSYHSRLSVCGDIRSSLTELGKYLRQEIGSRTCTYAALLAQAAAEREKRREALDHQADARSNTNSIQPIVAAREVLRAIGPRIPIVDEAIVTSAYIRRYLYSESPYQYSFLRGGALGWGMPAAVGCSLGLGREPVVCLVGDGAALYSPQALWTAAHEQLPVTFVVMNNREYNVLKNFMRGKPDYRSTKAGRFIAMDIDHPAVDYLALSRSMGVPAVRIEKVSEITPAVEAGIASCGPNLVEIVLGRDSSV